LRREVAKVTQEWHAEMEQTKQLQARLDNMRSSPRRNNSALGLDTMMDGLIQRIGQLENEVGKLRSVVERAVELKDATFDGERTMRQVSRASLVETCADMRSGRRPAAHAVSGRPRRSGVRRLFSSICTYRTSPRSETIDTATFRRGRADLALAQWRPLTFRIPRQQTISTFAQKRQSHPRLALRRTTR
jgi:hypothetical protein